MLICLLLAFGSLAQPAAALVCSATLPDLNFGTVDVTQNTTFATTSNGYSFTCTGGVPGGGVTLCFNFNAGGGGGGTPRLMKSGANTLSYDIYTSAAHTTRWGTCQGGVNNCPSVSLVLDASGNKTINNIVTAFGLINAGQQTAPTGVYQSVFSGANVALVYGPSAGGATCTNGMLANTSNTPVFNVNATVATVCTVSSSTLDFGSVGVLTSNVDNTTTVSATCSDSTPYTISLSLGSGTGVTLPTARKMTNAGATVTYGLYQDAGRTLGWGDVIGTNTVAATGSGLSQSYTVYGRVPPQTTPAPATYSDSIVATVTY